MEGIIGIKPQIKKIGWDTSRSITVTLLDGRIIIVPVSLIPSAKKTPLDKRNKPQIINKTMFTWEGCPEVYHIEQILGREKDYAY